MAVAAVDVPKVNGLLVTVDLLSSFLSAVPNESLVSAGLLLVVSAVDFLSVVPKLILVEVAGVDVAVEEGVPNVKGELVGLEVAVVPNEIVAALVVAVVEAVELVAVVEGVPNENPVEAGVVVLFCVEVVLEAGVPNVKLGACVLVVAVVEVAVDVVPKEKAVVGVDVVVVLGAPKEKALVGAVVAADVVVVLGVPKEKAVVGAVVAAGVVVVLGVPNENAETGVLVDVVEVVVVEEGAPKVKAGALLVEVAAVDAAVDVADVPKVKAGVVKLLAVVVVGVVDGAPKEMAEAGALVVVEGAANPNAPGAFPAVPLVFNPLLIVAGALNDDWLFNEAVESCL